MTTEQISFNDLPKAVKQVMDMISDLQLSVSGLHDEIKKGNSSSSDHTPMNIDEACEFMKMKKTTMYYHLQHRSIPATRKGKSYILFKDELIKWAESGRTNKVILTPDEINATLSKRAGKNGSAEDSWGSKINNN